MSGSGKEKDLPEASETTKPSISHVKYGIWDFYQEINPEIPRFERLGSRFREVYEALPFMWRMVQDVLRIRSCWLPLCIYVVTEFVTGLIPAITLWYSSQLVAVVRTAVEERSVDSAVLIKVAAGQLACSIAKRVLWMIISRCDDHLRFTIKQFYSIHTLRASARLDVPTFSDSSVKSQIQNSHSSVVWEVISVATSVISALLQALSQISVLTQVMRNEPDGAILTLVTIACATLRFNPFASSPFDREGVWAATTKNSDYKKMEGIQEMVNGATYRQEIVAGGMWQTLVALYKRFSQAAGLEGRNFPASQHRHTTIESFLQIHELSSGILEILPQIVFSLRAAQYPATIPTSLVSLNLVTSAAEQFIFTVSNVVNSGSMAANRFITVRRLYECTEIPNKVSDATVPFPENQQTLKEGISVEFRNVSFKYPDSETYALHNVSFNIGKGELCVIVGENGSGKSTILKLIARIYDPVEGDIFMDGHNIKALKLDDLRRATCVLFQDYTTFPLTIRDNIALGDPDNFDNDDNILQAVKLGGAEDFISKLPDGLETCLKQPFLAADVYSPPSRFKDVSRHHKHIQAVGKMSPVESVPASGGQLQRIALSRTFMRTVANDGRVGMLLFDEPSASLDPAAEHDLFERLRQLRGNKTMFFSSHRFGNLTRHADLILYIHKSAVLEEGTHAELVSKPGGEYARLWNIQAKQFLE
ncbi:P-loop containing nucleoside triphosphate hydrolase protein [Mycena floridula]|nr:P-loop containing nucleoside triphosphate hydrolase protein [Mycena floridula]